MFHFVSDGAESSHYSSAVRYNLLLFYTLCCCINVSVSGVWGNTKPIKCTRAWSCIIHLGCVRVEKYTTQINMYNSRWPPYFSSYNRNMHNSRPMVFLISHPTTQTNSCKLIQKHTDEQLVLHTKREGIAHYKCVCGFDGLQSQL